jgi:hypothetical protein
MAMWLVVRLVCVRLLRMCLLSRQQMLAGWLNRLCSQRLVFPSSMHYTRAYRQHKEQMNPSKETRPSREARTAILISSGQQWQMDAGLGFGCTACPGLP